MSFVLTGKPDTSETIGTKDSLPHDVGTKDNLPRDVAEIAILRSEVIAWTAFDPELELDLERFAFGEVFKYFLICPCAWPFLVILLPCLCCGKKNLQHRIRNQYWILTETDLKIVTMSYEECCIPGCESTGDSVHSIPLDTIIHSGAKTFGFECYHSYQLPAIFVDTSYHVAKWDTCSPQEAVGYGLAHQIWFIREILNRRDTFMDSLMAPNPVALAAVVATPVMDRGSEKSAADRYGFF
jgi:hypothetical protein